MAHVEIAMHHHGEIWPRRIVVEPALPPVEALVVHHELASDAVNVVGHLLTGLRRCTDEHPASTAAEMGTACRAASAVAKLSAKTSESCGTTQSGVDEPGWMTIAVESSSMG